MRIFRFRSLFSKLFVSVMLALILFAMAMIFLTKVLQDSNSNFRSEILAVRVLDRISPLLQQLNTSPNRLDARFTLADIKSKFDEADKAFDAKMGLYNLKGQLLVQTEGSDLSKHLPEPPSWFARTFPTLAGVAPSNNARVLSPAGYVLFFEPRQSPKSNAITAMFNLFTGTLLLLVMMALALWWLAHSMTWRLNRLSKQMQRFGEGDFSVRVPVSGNDEIATLAKGFNQSAEKIEKLINANSLLLAHASHEFRTPITRIRLQIEMMDMLANQLSDTTKAKFDKRANAVTRDLTGLNDLIESILLVSRLDAGHALQQVETIDCYQLIEQETQHYNQATLSGERLTIEGQPKLLTHLIRNLLNNAMIHGTPPVQVYLYGAESINGAKAIPAPLIKHEPVKHEEAQLLTLPLADSETEQSTTQATEQATTKQTTKQTTPTASNQPATNTSADTSRPVLSNQQATSKEQPPANEPTAPIAKTETTTALVNSANATSKKRNKLPTPKLPSRANRSRNKASKPDYQYLVIAVVDQGSGIPESKREDIFSPFVRLKQEKKGSGLGLSLVAQIVEAHQGSIITDTWQGHTRFLVTLPIHKAEK